ncbi:MAG: 30S ribosomal protein S6 [Firmicutes bacterium]|nr:30S ribosomal protein S6 [Bacillota bacterium]
MRPYEMLLVLQPSLEEEATDALLERLTGVVTSEGGTLDNVDRWGKRRLAYEINGFTEGFYVVIDFQAEPATASELERIVKIANGVIRHMLIRKDED